MNYLIIYDIEVNSIRTKIAKYLEMKGCVRIQKSVFIAKLNARKLNEIYLEIQDIQETYPNEDTILFIPVEKDNLMNILHIGMNEALQEFLDEKNTLFF